MNRAQTKKALAAAIKNIEVMQAFIEGKEIEYRYTGAGNEWCDSVSPVWSDQIEYRVKPEPRELWINEYDDNSLNSIWRGFHHTKEQADQSRGSESGKAVLYREVRE